MCIRDRGNITSHEVHTSGKDVTKDCKMMIALVNNEEWYTSEKEYVSGTVTIEKWDLENFKVTLVFKDYKCKSGSKSIVLNAVSYTHLDVYKRQLQVWIFRQQIRNWN